MREYRARTDSLRLDERGVALPLALFGLVAMSLLLTSILVTSSTELALSQAHQAGTRALYAADAALEQFVAQRAAMTTNADVRLVTGEYPVDLPSSGESYVIDVAELYRTAPVTLADGSVERRETYSLLATPADARGRSIGSLIEATRMAAPVKLNIDSGLTLGTDATIAGSATISDGTSPGAACDSTVAAAAIRHSSETSIHEQGNGHDIYGDIVQDTLNAAALMTQVLDGRSVDDLTELARIRFGPMFDEPLFSGSPGQNAGDPDYRWGCPAQLVAGCTAEQAAYFPTIAIDANGGTVDITGDHGQGIMIVRNGDLNIRGNFKFAGIVIAEGTLRVTGTPRLEGAVIAMGEETVIDPGDDSTTSGNSLIRFNKCQIAEAQRGLTMQSLDFAAQSMDEPTFAWFEVVR